jgi:hypothetical protein
LSIEFRTARQGSPKRQFIRAAIRINIEYLFWAHFLLPQKTGLSASIPRPIPYVYSRAGKNPGKMLVESASAICDTLRQRIPNIFPVSSPALLYTYRRVATEEEI